MIKKSVKTTKNNVENCSHKKSNKALTAVKKPKKQANPFKNADCIIAGKDFKVQKVVATKSGLKVKEKHIKRTVTTEKQFNNLIKK